MVKRQCTTDEDTAQRIQRYYGEKRVRYSFLTGLPAIASSASSPSLLAHLAPPPLVKPLGYFLSYSSPFFLPIHNPALLFPATAASPSFLPPV